VTQWRAWLERRGGFLVLPALVALAALFFNRLAFSNLILARGDTFLYFYPYWSAASAALRAGRVPLWNPDIFMGAPFLANSQAGFFYPLNWPVWLLLPAPYAVSATIVLHVVIAGAGAYLAGRRTLALGRPAALFGAALFALGGYLTAQVEHVNQLQGLAWLPWLFAAVAGLKRKETTDYTDSTDFPLQSAKSAQSADECSSEEHSSADWADLADSEQESVESVVPSVLAVGGLLALQLLAGHTQTAFISGVAVGVWLAAGAVGDLSGLPRPDRSAYVRRWLRNALVLAGGVALAAALSAVQLLPTLELAGLSSRQGGLPINEVLSFSWHPLHLTRALLPAYDAPLFSEYVAFLPLTGLALAVVGAWRWRRDAAVRPWVVLLVVALVLAMGRFTPIYHLLGRLPGFDLFRVPARWLAPAALAAALLAGLGWQRVAQFAAFGDLSGLGRPDRSAAARAARRELVAPLLAAAALIALLIVWGFAAGLLARFVPTGAEAPFAAPGGRALLGWLIEAALLGLLLWVILTVPRARARHAPYDLLALALAALWLGSRGLPYNHPTTPAAYLDLRPPVARLLALAECVAPGPCAAPPDRFLSLSDIFFDPGDAAEIESIYGDQLDEAARYDYTVAVKQWEVLSPNLSMRDGLPAIDGFDGGILPLASYGEVMRLILPPGTATSDGRLREYLDAAPDARWLSLFNGRYLITDKVGDEWREGVFFDRQHPVVVAETAVAVAGVPPFEATELWLLAGGMPPPVEIVTANGQTWPLAAELLHAPDLYRVPFPQPAEAAAIALLPCESAAADCGLAALTLVDARDGAFLPLTPAPYRLIHSGDVKIYENRDALPRAFVVGDWQWQPDSAAAVTAMSASGFDPARTAVLVGQETQQSPQPQMRTARTQATAEIVAYAPERVAARVNGAGGLLLLTDAHYPGWEATLDGAPTPIHAADGLFRGVFVPAGEHEVVFTFRPRSYRVGAGVSLLGLSVVVLGVVMRKRKRNAERR